MRRLIHTALLASVAAVFASSPAEANWEHLRIVGQRLGVPRILTFGIPPIQSIGIADVDGDGDADIVVSMAGSRDVTVFLGDPSQPFRSTVLARATDWATVDAETSVDGTLYRAQSSVLFPTTAVQSGPAQPPSRAASLPGALALVADVDGDGTVDLTPAPAGSTALASGDFDADGFADLVASTEGSASLTLRFGEQGRFSTRRTIDVGVITAPAGLAAGDINDDGVSDVALLSDSDTVSVFIGDGAGGLVPMAHMTVGRSPPAATAALASTSAPPAEYKESQHSRSTRPRSRVEAVPLQQAPSR